MRISGSGFMSAPLGLMVLATLVSSSSLLAQDERGWIGIEFSCPKPGCTIEARNGVVMVRSFPGPPVVKWVQEDGPAARAGLRAGDAIIAIDGVKITSEEGSRRFSAFRAGVAVVFGVRRAGRQLSLQVTPMPHREVYNEWHQLVARTDWDALIGRVKELYHERQALEQALYNAERMSYQSEAAGRQVVTEMPPEVMQLRLKIDSVRQEMVKAQVKLRTQTDSLAVRTLYVPKTPKPRYTPAPVAVPVPEPSPRTSVAVLRTYGSNAVAGARFEEMTKGLADYFQGVGEGLLVLKVVEGTPAYVAGLREGDVVVSVNDARVSAVDDLRRALRARREAKLEYVRKGKRESCKISSQ